MFQPWFSQAKLGIFIHWGIYAVKPTAESWPFFHGEISYEDYMAQCHGFTASKYDPHQWADLFHQAGARYAVLTTKHHDGFALWDTAFSDLNCVKSSPAKRDLVGPYCEALRQKGLKVGLYFSHLDWSHPDYATVAKEMPPSSQDPLPKPNRFYFREHNPEAWERFLRFHRGQLHELCTRYRPDLLWFDGDWERSAEQWRMAELRNQLHQWAPGVILNSRMKGYGDYETPEQGLPTLPPSGPWEFCMTCNDHWGYYESDKNYKSFRQILWTFTNIISKGGNLLLDFGPREDGTFPDEQLQIFRQLARWNTKHQTAVFPTGPGLPLGHYEGASTLSADGRTLYLFAFHTPVESIPVCGIRNRVLACRVLHGPSLPFRKLGGAEWHDIPGILWIDAPPADALDPDCTVIEIELDGPLRLFRGTGGAIEQN